MRYDDSNNRAETFVLTLLYGTDNWPYATTNVQSFIRLYFVALRLNSGHGLLILEVFLITHNDAPQSVGLL